jgi:DNA-binding MarR family transcriptional regulator
MPKSSSFKARAPIGAFAFSLFTGDCMYANYRGVTRNAPRTTVDPSDAGIAEGFSRWRAAMRWQRELDRALAAHDLTHTQYLVLWAAAGAARAARDAVPQRAIAEAAGLDAATTSQIVRKLEERGLFDRRPTLGDARAWRVLVTRSGMQLLRRATPLVRAAARRCGISRSRS